MSKRAIGLIFFFWCGLTFLSWAFLYLCVVYDEQIERLKQSVLKAEK